MNEFDCFIGIDWSGNGASRQRGIKVARAEPGRRAPQLIHCVSHNYWSRDEVASWIKQLVKSERALVGLDFSFGFPKVCDHLNLELTWDYAEKWSGADTSNFYGGLFFKSETPHECLVNSPWHKGIHRRLRPLRETEKAASRVKGATPQSVFNAIGAAQVGPSSISGMRMLRHLRKELGSSICIWPFDVVDGAASVLVEIFPRYYPLSRGLGAALRKHESLNLALRAFNSDAVDTAPSTEDEGDALLSAAALRHLASRVENFGAPEGVSVAEGWIFGVPTQGRDAL